MTGLMAEFEQVRSRNFVLEFTYPTEEERRKMNLINRDMNPKERKRIDQTNRNLREMLEALGNGEMHKEDLPQELIEKLKEYIL
jgi:superfamily I DNA and RNA helicase